MKQAGRVRSHQRHKHSHVERSAGFTLIELIIVMAIIGILVALLLTGLQSARETTRRVSCANNLKQLGLSACAHAENRGFFPASWTTKDPKLTWGRSLLPFLDQQALVDAWDPALDFEGVNGELSATFLSVYKCPSAPSENVYEFDQTGYPTKLATSDYKGCQGANASDPSVAHWNRSGWQDGVISRVPTPPAAIRDGLSQTILIVESVGGTVIYGPNRQPSTPARIWYATDGSWVGRALSSVSPTNYAIAKGIDQCTVNCSNMYDYGPYSFHEGGAQVVLGDGSVHLLTEEIDPAILLALYAYNDAQDMENFQP